MSLSTHDFSFFGFVGEGGGGVIPPVHKIWKVPIVTFWLVSWVKKKKTLPKSRWVFKDNGVASAIKESAKYPMTHSSSFSARYENRALKTWMFLYKKKKRYCSGVVYVETNVLYLFLFCSLVSKFNHTNTVGDIRRFICAYPFIKVYCIKFSDER